MKNKLLKVLVFTFICCFINSCSDEIVFDYSNPYDPISETFEPAGLIELNVFADTPTQMILTWRDKSLSITGFKTKQSAGSLDKIDDTGGYVIERSRATADNFVEIGRTGMNTFTYTDNYKFDLNTDYFYRIRIYSGKSVSKPSKTVMKSLVFKAPTNLECSVISDGHILLKWINNSTINVMSQIERRIIPQEPVFRTIASRTREIEAYEVLKLEKGKLYEFRICTVYGTISTDYTNTITYQY